MININDKIKLGAYKNFKIVNIATHQAEQRKSWKLKF